MKKILVVDDDEAILEAVCITLESEGYVVISTQNGDKVMKLVQTHKPDLIILDMLLSGDDGRDIVRVLKNNQETADIPVIMFSAHPTAKEESLAAGADDFIDKPFDINVLLKKVAQRI